LTFLLGNRFVANGGVGDGTGDKIEHGLKHTAC
jgi:hypothetical protein